MKIMIGRIVLVIASVAVPAGVFAQMNHDHSMQQMQMQMQPGTPAKAAPADGVVRSIDRGNGTVVIKHGPLTALNMPPMTMEFAVKDKSLLANVKEGDNIRFTPEQGKDGTLAVSTLVDLKN